MIVLIKQKGLCGPESPIQYAGGKSSCHSSSFPSAPWNVHTGADSYGPETRNAIDLETKFARFAELGFSAVQFHDDDAVPNMNNYDYANKLIAEKKFEQLEMYVVSLIMGI